VVLEFAFSLNQNQVQHWGKKINWKLVGDNVDLNIKQHHFFHSIAVQDRINTAHLDDSRPQQLVSSLTPFDFVPSSSHYKQLRSDLIILVSHIVVEFPAFQYMSEVVPSHILHQYPSEMAQPSVVVSYGNHYPA